MIGPAQYDREEVPASQSRKHAKKKKKGSQVATFSVVKLFWIFWVCVRESMTAGVSKPAQFSITT